VPLNETSQKSNLSKWIAFFVDKSVLYYEDEN